MGNILGRHIDLANALKARLARRVQKRAAGNGPARLWEARPRGFGLQVLWCRSSTASAWASLRCAPARTEGGRELAELGEGFRHRAGGGRHMAQDELPP